jgi:ABC-2 type transport system permease protein
MLRSIFGFEVRYHLRQPLFWIITPVFALLTFGAVTSDAVRLGGGIGNVHRNSPYVVMTLLTVMSILGMFVTTAFVASSANRDFEYGTDALFFSKPIRKFDYLAGRFSGSLLVSALVFVGCALGIVIGGFMPWLEPQRLGPVTLAPYVYTFLVFVLPNLLFTGAVFFSLASVTRSLLFTYLGVVAFFVVYGISGAMLADIENQFVSSLLDPFGLSSLRLATRYWTAVERNTALPPLATGSLLLNRLLWIGLGIAVFAIGFVVFNPARQGASRRRRRQLQEREDTAIPTAATPLVVPTAARSFTTAASVRQFLRQARIEVAAVLKSVLFLVILAFGITNVFGSAGFIDTIAGTKVYPVTHLMLQLLAGTFVVLLVIIVTFYGGELVGKERAVKLNEVYDALPTPTWVPLAAKLTALAAVILAFLAAGGLAAVCFQLYRGYHHLEPGLYVEGLLIAAVPFLLIAVLAVFLQVLANSKFLGYLLMILYLISNAVLSALDFDHHLYRFPGTPDTPYSDMNGYGHFLKGFLWLSLYWTFFALLLFGLSILLKVRGTESAWRVRWRQAVARFHGPVRALIAIGLLGFVATGAFIFYNTNVLNHYVPGDVQRDRQAGYEKKYRRYRDIPMPRVVAVKTDVDIFPRERRLAARGHYLLQNKTNKPIDLLHVNASPDVKLKLSFRDHRLVQADRAQGYFIYRLARPLAPGEQMPFDFTVKVENPGFTNDRSDTSLVYNGTFFNNREYFPNLGYDEGRQLVDRNERRKHGLPPVERMAKVDDLFARRNNYITRDSDWIDFETTVSTDPDQIAIAPGYLQREWIANGRRYFHYKMDSPMLHFYSYLSAHYEVRRDQWKGMPIEIYYQKSHEYNVGRMIDSVKKSLDYYTANFSPYQHRQVRILEFPRYASFAQSFANTIPFSEGIGFIADLRDPEAIDYVFYVTAHEVAHQWWAHQVIGGNVQGATMLSETMAQYSALMVMEKEYGRDKMRRFLKYELDRYLSGRGDELVEEMPLMRVENQQYIHYRKGSLITYALRDYIGEQALNSALARYIRTVAFQQPPYTNTVEFMSSIRPAVPANLRYILHDMFETITLFENRVLDARARRRPDGRYDVDLTLAAKKVRANGQGVETAVPVDDWIDVGVFAEEKKGRRTEEKPLYLEKHHITQPQTTLHLVVDRLPARAGIDPYNKLVDRNSDDNQKKVEVAAGG